MNVLAVLGSPRKEGNTSLLLDKYLEGLATHNDVKIEKALLGEKNIFPCKSCYACKNKSNSGCVIKDDMTDLYKSVKESDVLVFATPIYWWNMSAQMKIFIDRLFGLQDVKDFEGKKAVLLMTYGGELPNSGPEIVQKSIKEICDYLKIDLVQIYGTCTDGYVPVAENKKAQGEVYKMGKELE